MFYNIPATISSSLELNRVVKLKWIVSNYITFLHAFVVPFILLLKLGSIIHCFSRYIKIFLDSNISTDWFISVLVYLKMWYLNLTRLNIPPINSCLYTLLFFILFVCYNPAFYIAFTRYWCSISQHALS